MLNSYSITKKIVDPYQTRQHNRQEYYASTVQAHQTDAVTKHPGYFEFYTLKYSNKTFTVYHIPGIF